MLKTFQIKCVRNDLSNEMLPDGHKLDDHLDMYTKCKEKFNFTSGQIIILNLITDECKSALQIDANVSEQIVSAPTSGERQITPTDDEKQKHYAEFKCSFGKWIQNLHTLNQVCYHFTNCFLK